MTSKEDKEQKRPWEGGRARGKSTSNVEGAIGVHTTILLVVSGADELDRERRAG